ncbi:MAG: PASTA domain-containing protein, partial [Oscillospiraceae bacterium]|nr:PASTA domain-containing protein [Oscillospiraceae bacterium]
FEYSAEELRRETGRPDEPTRHLPNTGVTRTKQNHYTPPAYDEDDDEEYERPKSNWWKILILILLIAGAGYFGATRLYNNIMDSFQHTEIPEYVVPSVIGMTVEAAEALDEVKGVFEIVEEGHEYSTEFEEGQIIRQVPEAERTRKNPSGDLIQINVTVSNGPRSGAMLNVIGEEARTAKLRIQQTKGLSELRLNIVEAPEQEYHEEIEAGHVIRTDPAADTMLTEGETVTLVVSKGPEPKYSAMVFCEGQTVEWVQEQMTILNLVPEFTKVESSQPEGIVLTQSEPAGADVLQGSTVTFTYSNGQKLIQYPVSFDVPYSPDQVLVQIFLDEDVVFDSYVSGDYSIVNGPLQITLNATAGDHRLRIYAAEQLWRDEVLTFSE